MSAKYIISAVLGSFAIAFAADHFIADKKIFGGTTPPTIASKEWWEETDKKFQAWPRTAGPPVVMNTPPTIASKEWWEETDKKFQAWPRTAGPPVVMNPISRQNFIVKSRPES